MDEADVGRNVDEADVGRNVDEADVGKNVDEADVGKKPVEADVGKNCEAFKGSDTKNARSDIRLEATNTVEPIAGTLY